jgi:hypothetical protein
MEEKIRKPGPKPRKAGWVSVTFQCPPALRDAVDAEADAQGRSMGDILVAWLLSAAITKGESEEKPLP